MKVNICAKIRLPTHYGQFDVSHVTVQGDGGRGIIREGVVLEKGTVSGPVTVRVQSSCLFSESFGATDCDCALQLLASLERIQTQGGLVLYFYEEGRGAGLLAKFKAVELQQVQGFDTRQAYQCLNMSVDERTYEAAAAVLLELLRDAPISLLSNNPDKVEGLKRCGVNIICRERLIVGWEQPAVRSYLQEKGRILNHDIPN